MWRARAGTVTVPVAGEVTVEVDSDAAGRDRARGDGVGRLSGRGRRCDVGGPEQNGEGRRCGTRGPRPAGWDRPRRRRTRASGGGCDRVTLCADRWRSKACSG